MSEHVKTRAFGPARPAFGPPSLPEGGPRELGARDATEPGVRDAKVGMSRARQAFCLVGLLTALGSLASPALAQSNSPSSDELKAARELFQEAFKDEREKRYPEALEKFQRVAKVRESASVRYRVATVLVAMGRLREARDMYRALAAAKSSLPPSDREIADGAAERAAELDRRIPKLVLRVPKDPPEDLRVTVDGAPVPSSTTARSIELDPGEHVISASARGASLSEKTILLQDGGGEVSHAVILAPAEKPKETRMQGGNDRTPTWVAMGGGGALLLAGGALLVGREAAISEVNASCPERLCPAAKRSEVESGRDRAELFGPLGGALGIAGLAAIGVGIYWLVRSSPPASSPRAASHRLAPTGSGLVVHF